QSYPHSPYPVPTRRSSDLFAGNDDRAGVDVVGRQSRLAVGFVDELIQFIGINRRLVDIRGKQDWRFVNNFTINDHKAAGKRDALDRKSTRLNSSHQIISYA